MTYEKPQFILDYKKPKNTEIKHINGHWYLYERMSVYNPKTKKMKKKSGKCLGKITQEGFIASQIKVDSKAYEDIEVKEIGLSSFLYNRNRKVIEKLERLFPDIYREIFTIAAIRLGYNPRFKRISESYDTSILSELFPNLKLESSDITSLLKTIGKRSSAIKEFMKEGTDSLSSYMVFDGHRIISDSNNLEMASIGYDSKGSHKSQVNLVYAFSVSGERCFPYYYKQFSGDVPDITAFSSLIDEAAIKKEDLTILADKGFSSEDNFSLIEETGFKYIVPLKRNAEDSKENIPALMSEYDNSFTYNSRAILHKQVKKDGYMIHIFQDSVLLADELSDITLRMEKKNKTIELMIEKEQGRIAKGKKRRLTDEELENLKPISFKECLEDKASMGTITLRTNNLSLNGSQVYNLYKRREAIEDFFKSYDNSLDFTSSYMRNRYSEEAWLFFNHLSAIMAFDILDEIYQLGQTNQISLSDFRTTLSHIFADKINGTWKLAKITKKKEGFISLFDLNFCSVLNELNGKKTEADNNNN